MKRKIKFRAFLNSKYYENPRMLSWEELLEQYDAIDMFQRDLMTLMQYTGLHDKNGREIYEGDIVKMHQVVLSPDDKIGLVEYTAQYGYSIRFGNRRCRQSDWANDEGAKYEVIGNIFEDKQLLEASK
jgi:uncharacterized phage protein (TIGR01671 family)